MIEVLKLYITVLVMCEAGLGKPFVKKAKVVKTDDKSFYLYLPKEIFEHFLHTSMSQKIYITNMIKIIILKL